MIIWINGAFGAGKTTVAHELHQRLPDSFLFDPEQIGYFIRKHFPKAILTSDFQDMPLWRELTYVYLLNLAHQYHAPIIVPMTLVNELYFKEIVERLREQQVHIKHFTIIASKENLLKRLKKRGNGKDSWAAHQIDRCISVLNKAMFNDHIYSDNLLPEHIVDLIASKCGLTVKEDKRSTIKKQLDRLLIQLKQ